MSSEIERGRAAFERRAWAEAFALLSGPKDAAVLYSPADVADDLNELRVERSEHVRRVVATDDGMREAIDTLVRAVRP